MENRNGTVILIHGLWMNGLVFLPYQYWLERQGFVVRRFSYPSWSKDLEQNAAKLAHFIAETASPIQGIIAHSLGGIVALAMLEAQKDKRIRRLVLMGTPYAGCHCGQYMRERPVFAPLLGQSLQTWLIRSHLPIPGSLAVGIIAGTRSWGLGRLLPGLTTPNDGVVAVEETRLPGARDTIMLPVSHSGMLLSHACAEQAAHFLRTERFIHA